MVDRSAFPNYQRCLSCIATRLAQDANVPVEREGDRVRVPLNYKLQVLLLSEVRNDVGAFHDEGTLLDQLSSPT